LIREVPSLDGDDAGHGAVLDHEVLDRGLDYLKARGGRDRGLHRLAIKFAVGLGAGALDRGAFAAVQNPELDAGFVGNAAHQPVESVDLAHEMALAEAADGRIAGHFADCGKAVGDEGRARTHPRGSRGRLAAGMAAPDHDHVEALVHGPYLVGSRAFVKAAPLFHVNQERAAYLPMQNSAKVAPSTSSTSIRPVSLPRWCAAIRSSSALISDSRSSRKR
jgi:hypothetical protein